jgi:hypothetical protein
MTAIVLLATNVEKRPLAWGDDEDRLCEGVRLQPIRSRISGTYCSIRSQAAPTIVAWSIPK